MRLLNKVATTLGLLLFSMQAFADEATGGGQKFILGTISDVDFLGLMGLGAGLGVGLAAFGAASGQGKAAAAFMDGVSRNPSAQGKMFVPLVLSLALMESLVIFSFLVTNKLGDVIGKVLGQ